MNYQTTFTDGYMGGGGYTGCNYPLWKSDKELKTLLLQEYKKHGFKVSIRKGRGGWTTSLTITLTATENDLTESASEWEKEHGIMANQYRDHDSRFTEEFNKKLNFFYQITNSFNYDRSNSMVDYFDTGFYYTIYVKC